MIGADHGTLYHKVQIEIERILPHVFEASTAAALLRPYCSMIRVHLETAARHDLSIFKLTAWTTRPERIPKTRILAVPEPADDELLIPMRRTLKYTMHIYVHRLILRLPPDSSPPSPPPTPPSIQTSSDDESLDVAPRCSRSRARRFHQAHWKVDASFGNARLDGSDVGPSA